MFIKKIKKQPSKDSGIYYQFMLAQSLRLEGKVKQRNILYLGSNPLLNDKQNRAIVLSILKAKIFKNQTLFPQTDTFSKELEDLSFLFFKKYCLKYGQADIENAASIPPAPKRAEFHNIDIKQLEVQDVKSFGAEHLCKQVLDKLNLKKCLASLGFKDTQIQKSLISIAARAIFSSSEFKTSQILKMNSELQYCFGIKKEITHKQLYAVSDKLYKHKQRIDSFLHKRIKNIFNLDDKLVIFDISNTYFETGKADNKIAKYGRSKEKRSDCPLVVFTGVINAEGFIRHSRIYPGNTTDSTTIKDMIKDLIKHSPSEAKQCIVIDAGIATEDNLAYINSKGYKYVCVSRKRLKDYPIEIKPSISQLTDRNRNKIELSIFKPKGFTDTWMYIQSESKKLKEESMNEKLKQRYEEDLALIQKAIHTKGGTKNINKVWERIGRAKEKHNRVSTNYKIAIVQKNDIATKMTWVIVSNKSKEAKTKGIYFIRTNYQNPNEKELWDIYNTIREVEATFRCLKSDLNIRPIHHQKDHRIEAHIYLTILAYQLVNTIRYMLKEQSIKHDWRNIVRIMSTQTIQTIKLPTDKKTIHLRKPSKPIEQVEQIYKATNCKETQTAIKKYVVYH